MRMQFLAAGAVAVFAGFSAAFAGKPTESVLTPKTFAHLQKAIVPATDEDQWAAIPWLTSLWKARARAAAEGKPILLWEMDGHPLGCT